MKAYLLKLTEKEHNLLKLYALLDGEKSIKSYIIKKTITEQKSINKQKVKTK